MIKVKFISWGIMHDDVGNEYVCDADGCDNVKCTDTDEWFKISKRDEFGYPMEIESLKNY